MRYGCFSLFGAVDQAVSLVPVCLTNPEPPVTTTTDTGYFELQINAVHLQIHGTLTPAQLSMLLEGIDWRRPARTHKPSQV